MVIKTDINKITYIYQISMKKKIIQTSATPTQQCQWRGVHKILILQKSKNDFEPKLIGWLETNTKKWTKKAFEQFFMS